MLCQKHVHMLQVKFAVGMKEISTKDAQIAFQKTIT
jgi:hypothetical protein